MKQIVNKFDKHKINDLPRVTYPGRIVVVLSESEAERAIDYLMTQPILGFDTETKPSFTKHRGMNKVALLQVASREMCFLFRLNRTGITDAILRLLTDRQILKVGLSWHDDLLQLRRRRDFEPGTFVELQQYVKNIGIDDCALQKLYANLFGLKISKAQRLSNWDADSLSAPQQEYAAIDAMACLHLYEEITRLMQTGDYQLTVIPEPERPAPAPKDPNDAPKAPAKKHRRKPATPEAKKPKSKRKPRKQSPSTNRPLE